MYRLLVSSLLLARPILSQEFSVPTPPKGTQVNAIPQLGFGTWYIFNDTVNVVASAIENGFRHIDCAKSYTNQVEIGKGIKEGLRRSGLKRQDLWITSKLWNMRLIPPMIY
jgi:alcohol dehydrogenase (NADP+)